MFVVDVYCRRQILDMVPALRETNLISIRSASGKYENSISAAGWNDALFVEFDDFEHDYSTKSNGEWPYNVCSDEIADEMMEFIHRYRGMNFAVSCDGGISRSVAVGCFMRDFLSYKLHLNAFKHDWSKNKLVYILLGKVFGRYFKTEKKLV